MTSGLWRRTLFAAAVAMAFGAAQAQTATTVLEATQDYGKITVPGTGCVLVNNVWDRKITPEGFAQSVFLEKRGDEALPGWRWNAPGKRSAVLGMPELVCGDKPWDAPLGLRPEFPFRAGDKRLTADFDIELEAEGRYDMAFSLWAVAKLPAVKANITHEIMIMNANSGEPPAGDKIGTLQTGGTVFDIYLDKNQGMITGPDPFTWTLIEFIARKPLLKGSLDIGAFIDELLGRRILTRDHFLTDVELGNEVSDGAGRVAVRKLDLVIP